MRKSQASACLLTLGLKGPHASHAAVSPSAGGGRRGIQSKRTCFSYLIRDKRVRWGRTNCEPPCSCFSCPAVAGRRILLDVPTPTPGPGPEHDSSFSRLGQPHKAPQMAYNIHYVSQSFRLKSKTQVSRQVPAEASLLDMWRLCSSRVRTDSSL